MQSRFQIIPVVDKFAFKNVDEKYLTEVDNEGFRWEEKNETTNTMFTIENHNNKKAFKTERHGYIAIDEDGRMKLEQSVKVNALFDIEETCKIGENS